MRDVKLFSNVRNVKFIKGVCRLRIKELYLTKKTLGF